MKEYRAGIDIGSTTVKLVLLDDSGLVVYEKYKRHLAHTQSTLAELLLEAKECVGECKIKANSMKPRQLFPSTFTLKVYPKTTTLLWKFWSRSFFP